MAKKPINLVTEDGRAVNPFSGEPVDLIEGWSPGEDNLKSARNRLYFNGSSYSGADIKVVVHKYRAGPEEILPEIESAIAVYSEVIGLIPDLVNAIIGIDALKATVKANIMPYQTFRESVNERWVRPVDNIKTKEQVLLGSYYHQYIGERLAQLSTAILENPSSASEELFQIERLLDELTTSWKELIDAIQAGKGPRNFFQTKTLAELQTISISTFREKAPVRGFGAARVKGFTRGTRTVAGTMIFTVFDRNIFFNLLDIDPSDFDADDQFTSAIMDQMPPMDVSIIFANEYGSLSRMTIYGLEFVSEGKTLSIEDLLLEQHVQFVARDIDPMTPVLSEDGRSYSEVLSAYNQANLAIRHPERISIRASDLVGSQWDSREGEDTADTRFRTRFNPFY